MTIRDLATITMFDGRGGVENNEVAPKIGQRELPHHHTDCNIADSLGTQL